MGSSACSLGSGSPNAECTKGSARLLDAVYVAQDLLVQQKPQVFNKSQEAGDGTGQYLVVDREAYLDGIVVNLMAAGFCAQRDPADGAYERIHVKNENGEEKSYVVPQGKQLRVYQGDRVEAGDNLTEGPIKPFDILNIKGVNAAQEYLVNGIQEVYRLQGVKINDSTSRRS